MGVTAQNDTQQLEPNKIKYYFVVDKTGCNLRELSVPKLAKTICDSRHTTNLLEDIMAAKANCQNYLG